MTLSISNGYNKNSLRDILALAKEDAEKEYGFIYLPDVVSEQMLDCCRDIVKNYNSQIAFEEMKRALVEMIKRG